MKGQIVGTKKKGRLVETVLKEGSQWTSRDSQETIGELKPTGGNRKIVSFRVMYLSKASR